MEENEGDLVSEAIAKLDWTSYIKSLNSGCGDVIVHVRVCESTIAQYYSYCGDLSLFIQLLVFFEGTKVKPL